jgi:hypothetical protein
MKISIEEVKYEINIVGEHLGCDYTHNPIFPKGREDVCAVRHASENGRDYGFDTIYLLWKVHGGSIKHKELRNSMTTKDNIYIESIKVNKFGVVSVSLSSTCSYSGNSAWTETIKVNIGKK